MDIFKKNRRPPPSTFKEYVTILWILLLTTTECLSAILSPMTAEQQAPRFLSKGAIYRAVTGDSLALPCHVENVGNYIMLWRRGANVLTAASIIVSRDTRYSLDGNNLIISRVDAQDAGDYICQISDHVNRDLVHTVEILLPPTLRMVPSSGQLTVKQGGSVSMECKASGNPVPSVTWSKKNVYKKLSNGPVLALDMISMSDAGVYQCTAENGVGKPVSLDMKLDVLFPPNVTIEQSLVHSSENFDAQLVCNVLAEPQATVSWFRNSFSIQPTDRHLMTSRNGRHMLNIKNLQTEDFGNYSCMAENTLGRMKKFIEISGRPRPAEILSQPWSKYTDSYDLSLKVQSFPPIMEVRVMYRKLLVNETFQQPGRWHDIILTETIGSRINNEDATERIVSHHLHGLEASSIYEVIVQAKNRFGWSQVSEVFQFYTQKHSYEPRVEGVEQMISSIFRSSARTTKNSLGTFLMALITATYSTIVMLPGIGSELHSRMTRLS